MPLAWSLPRPQIDISKQGLNSVSNETVKLNLMGKSKSMEAKDWVDPQGRKGKGYGVYRFANKVGGCWGSGAGGPARPRRPARLARQGSSPVARLSLLVPRPRPHLPPPPCSPPPSLPPTHPPQYGANVDGYSPIYTPDTWSESGDSYKLGTKGLLAWAGLIVVLLGVGINQVISTSAIGQ